MGIKDLNEKHLDGGGGGGGAWAAEKHADAEESPPQATTDEQISRQRSLLNDVDHEAEVKVSYVDANLGIAEAHEVDTGKRVTLTWNTSGFIKETLRAGDTLKALVTSFQVATRVESVIR